MPKRTTSHPGPFYSLLDCHCQQNKHAVHIDIDDFHNIKVVKKVSASETSRATHMCTAQANVYATRPAFPTPNEPHRVVQIQAGDQEINVRGGISADELVVFFNDTLQTYCRNSYLAYLPAGFRNFNIDDIKSSAENLR